MLIFIILFVCCITSEPEITAGALLQPFLLDVLSNAESPHFNTISMAPFQMHSA